MDFDCAELERDIAYAEEECTQNDPHMVATYPGVVAFHAIWNSREPWQTHLNALHLATCMKTIDGVAAESS
ncbi:antibiotic biosynthesis monooxygenase [Ruegeria sp. HKCCD7559]|nr:antibiotic biosynthesis monooxygenase [Ruegeria sp. HKCCD7559]